ncbi:hypothetical protein DFJ73DRAFT_786582 [Zopfochytrium polystomum]|nr:hypothetical protein DFJ73DRAFT_786582 [Zopfochytrium polystomum]
MRPFAIARTRPGAHWIGDRFDREHCCNVDHTVKATTRKRRKGQAKRDPNEKRGDDGDAKGKDKGVSRVAPPPEDEDAAANANVDEVEVEVEVVVVEEDQDGDAADPVTSPAPASGDAKRGAEPKAAKFYAHASFRYTADEATGPLLNKDGQDRREARNTPVPLVSSGNPYSSHAHSG